MTLSSLTVRPSSCNVQGGELVSISGIPITTAALLKPNCDNAWHSNSLLSVQFGPTFVDSVYSTHGSDDLRNLTISCRVPQGVCVGTITIKVLIGGGTGSSRKWVGVASFQFIGVTEQLKHRGSVGHAPAIEHSSSELKLQINDESNSSDKSVHLQCLNMLKGPQQFGDPQSFQPSILHRCFAEMVGTFFIVLFGVGSVNAAVATGAQAGLWQVAVVWGFGVSLAILSTASISGAHLNPAVSLTFSILRPMDFALVDLVPYILAQLLGGFIGGLVNFCVFESSIAALESRLNITRGTDESVLTAMVFGEYFPNPGFAYSSNSADPLSASSLQWNHSTVTPAGSFAIEAFGTGVLMFMILALTDHRNTAFTRKDMAPFFIGFTVSCLISLYASLNQAGFNPARDFGPRLVAFLFGWGEIAIPGPQGGFWTYILGPCVGAPLGGAIYEFILARGLGPKHHIA